MFFRIPFSFTILQVSLLFLNFFILSPSQLYPSHLYSVLPDETLLLSSYQFLSLSHHTLSPLLSLFHFFSAHVIQDD